MKEREQDRASPQGTEEKVPKHARPAAKQQPTSLQKPVLDLHRTAGNQAIGSLLKAGAIQPKLRVSQPDDVDEREADRVADQVVSTAPSTLQRKCVSGPTCEEEEGENVKGIHREAEPSSDPDESSHDDLLGSLGSGQPLDPSVRQPMESSFCQDFGNVMIHTGSLAASSAKSVNARAFTTGQHIVFGKGEYSPHSNSGALLLAHELAHAAQNRNSSGQKATASAPSAAIKRESLTGKASAWFTEETGEAGKWVDEKKWTIYRAMIAGLKTAKTAAINQLRGLIPKLPTFLQGASSSIIDVVDFFVDLEISLLLAIIGLAVGFVEGIVGLVTGLVKLALDLIKMTVDYLVSLMGRPEEYQQDVNALVAAVKGIPPGLAKVTHQWLERYQRAPVEEQVLMGGELVGEIEAFIATFAFAGTKAGQATTLTVRGGELGAQVAAKTGVAVLEPAVSITIPAVVPKTAAEAAVVSSQIMAMSAAGSGGGGSDKLPRTRNKAAADRFLREQLQKVSDPKHPLHFLVEPKLSAEGKPLASAEGNPLFDWRKATRTTESGKVQLGRYQANESGVSVQVGHQTAFTSGAPEQFTLEDADLNQLSGQVVESKGALSVKPAVDIEGVPVDLQSAEQWERLELLSKGTVAKSPKISAPLL